VNAHCSRTFKRFRRWDILTQTAEAGIGFIAIETSSPQGLPFEAVSEVSRYKS
jgi:hypothetical protein